MASLRVQCLHLPAIGSTNYSARRQHVNYSRARAAINVPSNLSPKGVAMFRSIRPEINLHELTTQDQQYYTVITETTNKQRNTSGELLVAKLQTIAEAVADRVEMHSIIGEQRNNWNHLFLHSINSFALSASLITGFSASLPPTDHVFAFKLSSMLLLTAAAGMMFLVNKIQPSQLAEEQRNATRLWKQLGREINQTLSKKSDQFISKQDVSLAMEKVLALDKAYPLPLLPGMLEKFPEHIEPTRWWPKKQTQSQKSQHNKQINLENEVKSEGNGWTRELEEAMAGLKNVLQMKDESYYMELANLVSRINKGLAVSGPIIAGLAAIATGFVDSSPNNSWALVASIAGGSLVAVLNTLEHGAQLGMIFEIFRNCPGLYKKIQEEIECNLSESDVGIRENGEIFAMRVALQLGRSVSELKDFKVFASPCCKAEDMKEFASKLF